MALGENMKRKTLIPTSEEEFNRHALSESNTNAEETVMKPHAKNEAPETSKEATKPNEQEETNQEVTLSFKPSLRTKVNKINVGISGRLNIYNLPFILEKINERCDTYSTVDVIIKEVEEIDLSFIQFAHYYALQKKSQNHAVTFDMENPAPALVQLINQCNYSDLLIKKKLS